MPETKTILFVDKGSHRSWVLQSISKYLSLKQKKVENLSIRVFLQEEENPQKMKIFDGIESTGHLVRSPNIQSFYFQV
jgi:hypothetical protein